MLAILSQHIAITAQFYYNYHRESRSGPSL